LFEQLPSTSFMSSKPDLTTHLAAKAASVSPPGPPSAQVNDSNRVENLPGYTTPVFKGKEEQRAIVEREVAAKVIISLLME
jgi:glutamate dehydrogenase